MTRSEAGRVLTRPNSYPWTKMRLLAGHLLLFDKSGVTPVFCELHAPIDDTTSLAAYEDSSCKCLVVSLIIEAWSQGCRSIAPYSSA